MKFRCIRRDYRDGSGGLSYLPMEVGCVYEIVSTWSDRVSVGGYLFSMGENKIYLRNFDDYFLSIEDYRDLLIDEICE